MLESCFFLEIALQYCKVINLQIKINGGKKEIAICWSTFFVSGKLT